MEMESRSVAATSQEPHSCKHCQKLILHLPKRYGQQNNGGIRDVNQNWIPSRALLWLESFGMSAPIGSCIFDVTIAEMREAAVQGCSLFDLLLKGSAADIPGALFLVGYVAVDDSIVEFRVLSQKSERRGNRTSLIPLLARGEEQQHCFTICADAGMLSLI
jgi:hypothetical protein